MERAGGLRGRALRVSIAALALCLAASCGAPVAPLRVATTPAVYPPKPPPRPAARPAAPAAPPRVVTVVRGDSVYGIARRHGVPIRTVIEINRLRPPYILKVGQTLELSPTRYHVVKPGETVYAISRLYDVDLHSLTRLNRIAPPYTIAVGLRLVLPGSVAAPSPPPAAGRTAPSPAAPAADARPQPAPRPAALASAESKVPRPPPRAGKAFAWPVGGRIISNFGSKGGGLHNDGVNIAGPRGAPVRAAENGVVAYAGNELRGFGNLLLVRHAGGWTTAYAHNDALQVRRGDTVQRGQVIARLGSTGHVATPQLHFEIRKGSKAVDPLPYLGPKPTARSLNRGGRPGVRQAPG